MRCVLYVEEHGKNGWTKLFAIPIDHDKLTNLKMNVLPIYVEMLEQILL